MRRWLCVIVLGLVSFMAPAAYAFDTCAQVKKDAYATAVCGNKELRKLQATLDSALDRTAARLGISVDVLVKAGFGRPPLSEIMADNLKPEEDDNHYYCPTLRWNILDREDPHPDLVATERMNDFIDTTKNGIHDIIHLVNQFDKFSKNIKPSDYVGDWVSGKGYGHISISFKHGAYQIDMSGANVCGGHTCGYEGKIIPQKNGFRFDFKDEFNEEQIEIYTRHAKNADKRNKELMELKAPHNLFIQNNVLKFNFDTTKLFIDLGMCGIGGYMPDTFFKLKSAPEKSTQH